MSLSYPLSQRIKSWECALCMHLRLLYGKVQTPLAYICDPDIQLGLTQMLWSFEASTVAMVIDVQIGIRIFITSALPQKFQIAHEIWAYIWANSFLWAMAVIY